MKKLAVLLFVASALGFAARAQAAAPPSGVYSNSFTGPLSVWDVSGTYNESILGGGISGNYTLTQDSAGKITGAGTVLYGSDGISLNVDFTFNGSVKTANGVTSVLWVQKFKGAGVADGQKVSFSGAVKANLTVDQTTQTLKGTLTGKACAHAGSHSGCAAVNTTVETALPGAMDGVWNLVLNLTGNGTRVQVVSASLVLSNGRSIPLSGSGSYSAASDQTKLKLKGATTATDGRGVQLSVVGQGANLGIVGMTGRVLGQKLKK